MPARAAKGQVQGVWRLSLRAQAMGEALQEMSGCALDSSTLICHEDQRHGRPEWVTWSGRTRPDQGAPRRQLSLGAPSFDWWSTYLTDKPVAAAGRVDIRPSVHEPDQEEFRSLADDFPIIA